MSLRATNPNLFGRLSTTLAKLVERNVYAYESHCECNSINSLKLQKFKYYLFVNIRHPLMIDQPNRTLASLTLSSEISTPKATATSASNHFLMSPPLIKQTGSERGRAKSYAKQTPIHQHAPATRQVEMRRYLSGQAHYERPFDEVVVVLKEIRLIFPPLLPVELVYFAGLF